jgi:hypothetical protein
MAAGGNRYLQRAGGSAELGYRSGFEPKDKLSYLGLVRNICGYVVVF